MKQQRNLSHTKRSPSPQFLIKRVMKPGKSSMASSPNTSLHSHFEFPEEGKLLNLIMDIEQEQEKSIFNLKLSSFSFGDVEQKLAISDDPNNAQLRRQLQYNKFYHQEYQQSIQNETVYIGSSLKNQKISQQLRGKMVDWTIEVLGNYNETTSSATFFRAISLMDYYLSKSTTVYQDHHLHLIGMACIFMASKIEDIYHIPLDDVISRIGHNKYSGNKIKSMEQNILESLSFDISFPTALDHLQNIYYQCFSLNDDPKLNNIFEASVYILKMCLHDYTMTSYNAPALAAAAFFYSIRDLANQRLIEITQKYCDRIILISRVGNSEFKDCFQKLNDLINQFKDKYPDFQNLDRFS